MKFFPFFSIFILVLIAAAVKGFLCPTPQDLDPCTCGIGAYGVEVQCEGLNVTTEILEIVIKNLRNSNGLNSTDILQFHRLAISRTSLTTLDLTPLTQTPTKLKVLDILYNYNLTSIVGPAFSTLNGSTHILDADLLTVYNSALTDQGLGRSLQYFAPSMAELEISYSNIQGGLYPVPSKDKVKGSEEFEFLPGLSALTRLRTLDLGGNKISEFRGPVFKQLSSLLSIHLSNNKLTAVHPDFLLFDLPPAEVIDTLIYVDLTFSGLTDGALGHNLSSGLTTGVRPIYLDLYGNDLETLSEVKFRPLLLTHFFNLVDLDQNPLVCDSNLRWLKDDPGTFVSHVLSANCINDPAHTVWDSGLIS